MRKIQHNALNMFIIMIILFQVIIYNYYIIIEHLIITYDKP